MPFGRFRGVALPDVPDDYLAWLAGLDDLRSWLRRAVDSELERRAKGTSSNHALVHPCPAPDVARDLINAGLRWLARRHHPDAGGSHDAMVKVTTAADWLREQIAGTGR